jgi:hypothetical protein
MSLRWRWSLVVVLAATVLGGFMPQALLSGSHAPASMATISRTGPPTFPSGCSGNDCGKSAPVAPTPSLMIAALAGMAGVLASVAAGPVSRRIRSRRRSLPRGTVQFQFHPPKFSGFGLIAV